MVWNGTNQDDISSLVQMIDAVGPSIEWIQNEPLSFPIN
jgi:hypothetical protein